MIVIHRHRVERLEPVETVGRKVDDVPSHTRRESSAGGVVGGVEERLVLDGKSPYEGVKVVEESFPCELVDSLVVSMAVHELPHVKRDVG